MAKYKNREVRVLRELPHPNGDQVEVEHLEPGVTGKEIVPVSQVWVSKDEKKAIDDQRKKVTNENDFRVEGVDDPNLPATLPSTSEVMLQRSVERGVAKAEDDKKKQEEWQKKHPDAPTDAQKQIDAVKVVPTLEETK